MTTDIDENTFKFYKTCWFPSWMNGRNVRRFLIHKIIFTGIALSFFSSGR